MHVIPSSYDNSLPKNSQIQAFYDVLAEVGKGVGIDLAVAQKFHGMLEKAGYEGVTETVFDLPLGGWMPDRRMREVGLFQQFQVFPPPLAFILSFTLALEKNDDLLP